MNIRKNRIPTYLNYAFFVFLSLIMLYPLWYVLMFSLSAPNRSSINNYYLIPDGFSLVTYKYVLNEPSIIMGFKNSAFVTIIGTFLCLLMTAITAYPLSRDNLTGKRFFFNMMFFTMLFNGGLIPTYLVVRAVGLNDSLWALIIPASISVYNMLIMIKFFKNIPVSLIESAKIDGYSDISIFIKIVLPLSRAVLSSIGLFCAVALWNTYLSGVIYIVDTKKRVLMVIIRAMIEQESLAAQVGILDTYVTPQNLKMAAIIVTLLPIICVYPFLQKYFAKGVMLGSVKG